MKLKIVISTQNSFFTEREPISVQYFHLIQVNVMVQIFSVMIGDFRTGGTKSFVFKYALTP